MKKLVALLLLGLCLTLVATGIASAAPLPQAGGQEYIVQADDWLSKLAEKNYGDVLAWPVIWEATNAKAAEDDSFAQIENPNLIEVGQKLWIPDPEEATTLLAERESNADADIKIGFAGPLTGGAAFLGQEQLNFAKVAVSLFNEETGLNVQLVEGDDMMSPDEGKIVAERFVADPSILAVVGPAGSQICESTQPIFADAGLTHITPSCTRTTLTDPGTPTFFRVVPTDADQGPTDAAYMVNTLGVQSAYLVDDQSSYAVGLTDELEAALNEMGVTEVQRASVNQQDTDFSSLVTTIMAANPDVVFFPGQFGGQLATLAIQLREQNYDGIYFLADGAFDPSWVETAGDAAEGTYLSFFAPDPHFVPQARDYVSRYEADFGEFGAFGGPSGLAARVALEAIKRCSDAGDLSRACVVTETAATNLSDSVLGVPVSFGPGNQIAGGKFFIFQVKDGAFVLVE
ncbi:MAG TPA: ABC transporter substrate-binding protein [Anaerolineae bacterium]|nr:ABC transporter substrate-binding protein [Anaerolineae bacterium]